MKTSYISILFTAALMLNGCSGTQESATPAGSGSTTENPNAIIAQTASMTRTALDASNYIIWNSGDQIRVYGASAPAGVIYITSSNKTRTGIFTAPQQTVNDETRYAVYPASVASGSLSETAIDIDFAALSTQPYSQSLGTGTAVSRLPMVAASEDNNFLFKNTCGGIQFQLNDYQGLGIKIKSIVLTAKGGEQLSGVASVDVTTGLPTLTKGDDKQTITVDCGGGANISSEGDLTKNSGFILFLPAATYEGFSFAITDTEGVLYQIETNQSITVTAGSVTPLKPLLLTRYYGSSNCYRTAEATTLKIDATPYYTFSDNFAIGNQKCVDAKGNVVSAATKAKIIWQQPATTASGDVVTASTLSENTLSVTTSGKAGNAVVAICNSDDVILWSYHIWVSEANDVSYTYTERGTYNLLDRNLGATSTTLKDRNAYGLLYQWGRKDPLVRNLTADRPAGSPYESTTSDLEKVVAATEETGTIAYAVRNPDTRLTSSTDWCIHGGSDLLWGWIDAKSGIKTVYDPCPAGYRVPDIGCYNEFPTTDKTNCNAQYGHMISGAYFPTGGYLSETKDVMLYLEYRGYLWNNQPGTDSTNPGRVMYNNSGITVSAGAKHASGMPVRCLKIE